MGHGARDQDRNHKLALVISQSGAHEASYMGASYALAGATSQYRTHVHVYRLTYEI